MGLRGDEVGLFWEEAPPVVREPKAPIIREPVVMKPYQPRIPIQFQPLTDEELIEHKSSKLIFDTECFANFFLVAFKHLQTGHVLTLQNPIDADKLAWIMHNYTCIGFNSLKYDLPLIWLTCTGADTQTLKLASNDLIQGLYFKQVQQKYSFSMPHTSHIDLIDVCPLRGSLKLYAARLHAIRIQDVPWAAEQALEDWQIPITTNYCVSDLDATELIFNNLFEQRALREVLSKEYGQDLLSKSDAQIAEAVIGSELKRIKGRYPSRPKVKPGTVHHFVPPSNLQFQTDHMRGMLTDIEKAEFKIGVEGYLEAPKEIQNLEVKLGAATYRMGIGGLHSSEECTAHIADGSFELFDFDVAGYYPSIILNCKLYPKHLGEDFFIVYKNIVDRRLAAKKAGDLAVSENLKVTANGTFGKTGSPYSILYAPEMTIQITVGGQLYLLMLIESLELAGISVVSANTDGIMVKCPKDKKEIMLQVIKAWEQATGFITEETQYKAIYSRDVNTYLAVRPDGRVKGKNIFYDPWRSKSAKDSYWRFQKNPTCQICVEAVEQFIAEGISLEQTILGCQDITKFVAIKNVTGGAHWDGEYLGKTIRWYYAQGVTGTINYIVSNRIVADSEGAQPLMDLLQELPANIDYDRYIRRAEDMLKGMGWKSETA